MIPLSIKIGGIDYAVSREVGLNNGERMLCGRIDYDEGWIKLSGPARKEDVELQTLWHEVLHGLLFMCGSEHQHDEKLVDQLA